MNRAEAIQLCRKLRAHAGGGRTTPEATAFKRKAGVIKKKYKLTEDEINDVKALPVSTLNTTYMQCSCGEIFTLPGVVRSIFNINLGDVRAMAASIIHSRAGHTLTPLL